jgi:S-adenosylmethionine decarboxylase
MQGLHLTADLHRCRCDSHWLLDAQALGRACVDAVVAPACRPLPSCFTPSPPPATAPVA